MNPISDAAPRRPSADAPPVVITEVVPSSGFVGEMIEIRGSGFAVPDVVLISGLAAAIVDAGATVIRVQVPLGATTGFVFVKSVNGEATSPGLFVVDDTSNPPQTLLTRSVQVNEPYVVDLQADVNSWGDAFAKRMGTSCRWVDLFAERKEMRQYGTRKLTITALQIQYGTPLVRPRPDSYTYVQSTVNQSSLPQSGFINQQHETTSGFKWSLTEGLKTTASAELQLKGKAGLPLVAEGEAQVKTGLSIEINFSSTQETNESTTERWIIQQNVSAAAERETTFTWRINQSDISVPWQYQIQMTGYVAIWLNDKRDIHAPGGNGSNRHWLWFIPVERVFTELANSRYQVTGDGVMFTARGTFDGVGATLASLDVKEAPLPGASAAVVLNPPLQDRTVPLQGSQAYFAEAEPATEAAAA